MVPNPLLLHASPAAQLHKSQHDGAGRMAPGSTGPTGTSKPSLLALGPLRNVGISQEFEVPWNAGFFPESYVSPIKTN